MDKNVRRYSCIDNLLVGVCSSCACTDQLRMVSIMSGDEWKIDSDISKKAFLKYFEAQWDEHKHLSIKMKTGKQATPKQLNSMHLFIRHTVAELNDRGVTVTEFFKVGFELPWTEDIFREHCWKPLQKAIMEDNKAKSTKDQTRDIPGKVHEILTQKFTKWGFYVPWPDKKDR